MFWMLYLLPAAFAASKVAPKHGFLAGIATWSPCWYAAPGDRNPYLNRSGSPGYRFGYADACSVALAQAFAEIARMAGAKFGQ